MTHRYECPHCTTSVVGKPSLTVASLTTRKKDHVTTSLMNEQDETLIINKTVCSLTKRYLIGLLHKLMVFTSSVIPLMSLLYKQTYNNSVTWLDSLEINFNLFMFCFFVLHVCLCVWLQGIQYVTTEATRVFTSPCKAKSYWEVVSIAVLIVWN